MRRVNTSSMNHDPRGRSSARGAATLLSALVAGLGASTGGCNAVLGLGDFTDATTGATTSVTTTNAGGGGGHGGSGQGGATSTGGSAQGGAGGATTNAGGAGGAGGAAKVWDCAVEPLKTIFTVSDLGDAVVGEKGLFVLAEPKTPQSGDAVHVVVYDSKNGLLLGRTWTDQAQNPVGDIVKLAVNGNFAGIRRDASGVSVFGTFDEGANQVRGAGEVRFDIDPTTHRLTGTPKRVNAPMPAGDCSAAGAKHEAFAESMADSPRHYAGTCSLSGKRTLYAGTWGGSVDVLDQGGANDERFVADHIEPMGPLRMILLGGDASTWVRVGAKLLDLGKAIPISLAADRATLPYAMAPLPNDQGVALFLATLTPQAILPATLYGGRILPKNLPALGSNASSLMTELGEYTKLDQVNLWSQPSLDATTLFAAGVSKTSSVRLYWMTRDLDLRVFGYEVDVPAAPDTFNLNAAIAHLGTSQALVAYTRLDPQQHASVLARPVTCL